MRCACCLLFGLMVTGFTARADLWTNQAGQVINARLGECDGRWVTLLRTNAPPLRLPLSSLKPADQNRIRTQKGISLAPDFVQVAYRDATAVFKKYEQLPVSRRTEDSKNRAIVMAVSLFDARIKARSTEIADKAVIAEIGRMRTAITNYMN